MDIIRVVVNAIADVDVDVDVDVVVVDVVVVDPFCREKNNSDFSFCSQTADTLC
jgi:hypothetical protein